MTFDPKTRAEAEKKRYGVWTAGGRPGNAYDPKRCVVEVSMRDRWSQHYQCNRPSGHGPEELYCRQHDPAAVEKRAEESRKREREERERERPKWYGRPMLEIIRRIAAGHNDPTALCREFIEQYDRDA